MKGKVIVSAVMLALATTGAGADFLLSSGQAVAAEKAVSAALGKPLQAAQAALKAKNARAALSSLAEAEGTSGRTAYDNLVINQLKVSAYSQLGDNAGVARSAEAVLGSGQVSGRDAEIYRSAAANAYYALGNLEKFKEYGKNNPELQPMLAQAYLKQGNAQLAESTIRQAIANAGGGVREEWYLLLSAAQRKNGNAAGAAETIQTLLKSHPKPEYWLYVLKGMLNQKGVSDKQRLDIYRLIYITNSFQAPSDYTDMAESALVSGAPDDAKRALEKGIAAGVFKGTEVDRPKRLLAKAVDKSAQDLQKLSASEAQAATGDALAGVADGYLGNGQYEKAAGLYQSAIAKGGLTDLATAKLHLGVALAAAKQSDKARQALAGVTGKGMSKELASLWQLTLR